jgi:hypothetical protein
MTDDNYAGKVLMRGDISDEEHRVMLELAEAITALTKYLSGRDVFATALARHSARPVWANAN